MKTKKKKGKSKVDLDALLKELRPITLRMFILRTAPFMGELAESAISLRDSFYTAAAAIDAGMSSAKAEEADAVAVKNAWEAFKRWEDVIDKWLTFQRTGWPM